MLCVCLLRLLRCAAAKITIDPKARHHTVRAAFLSMLADCLLLLLLLCCLLGCFKTWNHLRYINIVRRVLVIKLNKIMKTVKFHFCARCLCLVLRSWKKNLVPLGGFE